MKKFSILVLATLFLTNFCNAQQAEEDAIKAVLAKDAATWRSGDVKGHNECWKIQPYSRTLVSTADGKSFDIPAKMMGNSSASMGNGGSAEASNFNFSIHGDNAWVSHDEISTSKDGVKTYSHELRILEKIEGQWKLVAQSIHIYKPE